MHYKAITIAVCYYSTVLKSHGLISGKTELLPLTIAYVSKLQDLPKPLLKICKLGEHSIYFMELL